jgi:hypothetical protein
MFIAAKILHNHRATGNLGVGRVFFASYLTSTLNLRFAYFFPGSEKSPASRV